MGRPRIDPRFVTLIVAISLIAPQILPQLTHIITGEDATGEDFERGLADTLQLLLGVEPPVTHTV